MMYNLIAHRLYRIGTIGTMCRAKITIILIIPVLTMSLAGCVRDKKHPLFRPQRHTVSSEGDTYSILLAVLSNPVNHVRDADYYKRVLTEKLGWKDVFVVHKEGYSTVFWGHYRTWKEAQPNLRIAKAYRAANGSAVFAKAIIVPLPGKDIGPNEWNLKNVNASYSLLVAVFRDDPKRNYFGRKRFAVQYCRRLRKAGYEAYFYHSPVASHVTIGAFGPESISIKEGPKGKILEIKDPRIKALQHDFPYLAVNGAGMNEIVYDPKTRKEIRIPVKTYLIRIPHGKNRDQSNDTLP